MMPKKVDSEQNKINVLAFKNDDNRKYVSDCVQIY